MPEKGPSGRAEQKGEEITTEKYTKLERIPVEHSVKES
jgi:hypothetical protein